MSSRSKRVAMKKLFIVADIHSFYDEMITALSAQGFDREDPDHIFVSLGDLFDRGPDPLKCLEFVNALPADRKILIRGNHEDLLMQCLERQVFLSHDLHNGTMDTVCKLAGENAALISERNERMLFSAAWYNPELRAYYDALRDYAEIEEYVFVHGWIPARKNAPGKDWHLGDWREARWMNGMEKWKQGARLADKTIFCGHWHTSWGHAVLEKRGTEFGEDADFSPFIGEGIVALDACTVLSHKVNCFVIEMEEAAL